MFSSNWIVFVFSNHLYMSFIHIFANLKYTPSKYTSSSRAVGVLFYMVVLRRKKRWCENLKKEVKTDGVKYCWWCILYTMINALSYMSWRSTTFYRACTSQGHCTYFTRSLTGGWTDSTRTKTRQPNPNSGKSRLLFVPTPSSFGAQRRAAPPGT
jgi:hypothetical protein